MENETQTIVCAACFRHRPVEEVDAEQVCQKCRKEDEDFWNSEDGYEVDPREDFGYFGDSALCGE